MHIHNNGGQDDGIEYLRDDELPQYEFLSPDQELLYKLYKEIDGPAAKLRAEIRELKKKLAEVEKLEHAVEKKLLPLLERMGYRPGCSLVLYRKGSKIRKLARLLNDRGRLMPVDEKGKYLGPLNRYYIFEKAPADDIPSAKAKKKR